MIDIIIFIIFSVMGFRIATAVRRESDIFTEFNQPRTIGWLSLLFPLGPIIYITTAYRFGWLVAITLMVACYLPVFLSAKNRIRVFDRAGTDRVNKAKEAAMQAYGTSIAGLIYTGILLAVNIIGSVNA